MKKNTVELTLEEALRIYDVVAKAQQFFHQPMHFTPEQTHKFADDNYQEIHKVYYDFAEKLLPTEVFEEICDGYVTPQDIVKEIQAGLRTPDNK